MQSPLPLHAAIDAAGQANQDLLAALEALQSSERVNDKLSQTTALAAITYALNIGMTPAARTKLVSAQRMLRAALGIEGNE